MNININKDDSAINDYLYAWNILNTKPSKYVFNAPLDTELFSQWLNDYKAEIKSTDTDFFPSIEEESVVNKKKLYIIELGDLKGSYLLVSFTHFDVLTEDSIIGDVCLYYNAKDEEYINKVAESLVQMQIDLDDLEGDDESKPKMVYTLASNGGALDAEQIDIPDKDFSNIELYYNHGVVKKVDKLIKSFNKNKKGIGLIFGPRG
ncbi:hypothetical protein EBU94_05245, partial [bacterium]|nr:hypothetical protein [bacterium]